MVRSGDQEPSPGGTRPSEAPQVPAARRASRLTARWKGASRADSQASGAEARLADQEDTGQVPFRATLPDWDTWAARRAEMPSSAPQSSAADLRELAELGDLLGELAGLVRDLGALIMGLITAAAGVGGRPPRAFAVPPELAELAGAHQELKAEQRALSGRFESGTGDSEDRTALRASLAVLTERATRAVAVAAAVSFPPGRPPVPAAASSDQPPAPGPVQPSGTEAPVPGPVQPSGTEAPVPGPVQPSGTEAPAPGPVQPSGTEAPAPGPVQPSGTQAPAPVQPSGPPDPAPGPVQPPGATPASPPPETAPRGAPGAPSRHQPRKESRVQMQAPVAVALDAPDIDVAAHWATLVTPYVSTVKIGLELYLRYGPTVVATVRGGSGVQVFLDLKLHDIPNTVAGAARAVAKLRPEILTVHAAGGADMIKAAVQAAPETLVAGVTLLTSIGGKDLTDLGVEGSASDAVRRMAVLAVSAGARGLVCSPQEVAAVRAEVGPDILLITPGIRPSGATSDDQARIATPVEALKAGADLLVIGRPITRAPDPGAAASAIAMSLRRAVAAR